MKLGVGIAPNSPCLSLLLGHWGSFSFGVENVLVSSVLSPIEMHSEFKISNAHNSSLEGAVQLKQAPLDLSFHFLWDGIVFSKLFFDFQKSNHGL